MVPNFLGLIRDSVVMPGETAERLLALRPATRTILESAVLVSVLDALLLGLLAGGRFVLPLPSGDVLVPPLAHAAVLLASLVLTASAIQIGGRFLGGQGRFSEALLVVVWMEVLALGTEIVLLAASLLLPPLTGILGIAGLAVLLWCLVHFIRALHGFAGLGRAVAALLIGAVAVGLALSLLLGAFGVAPDV